ncbi:phage/plasmid replication domain-containing protein [Rhodoferax ferrireducens]|uniref:phage/plasmid replication domain-containing protein n=1 Tax=Rhodoferax ferrireducens TaxID=192843 RepID=UPI000E0D5A8D|nr:phage/plasmid replication protein [Rhodoferax ferrireducens]
MQVTPHQMFTGEQKSLKSAGKPLLSVTQLKSIKKAKNQPLPVLKSVANVACPCPLDPAKQPVYVPAQFADLNRRDDPTEPFFVDWLTMRQSHEFELPVINAGVVCGIDAHGEIEWQTQRASQIEGSFDTSIQLRCDGHTVLFSGNVSRFGRTNNLFGFSFADCLRRVNHVLARFGLPPFSAGKKMYRTVRHSDGACTVSPAWTGATISRIDLTGNYETGSLSNARAYLEWLATQQGNARLKVGTRVDGETVDWGRGSRRLYSKIYIKSAELRKHAAPGDLLFNDDESLDTDLARLVRHCENVGLVRFEVTAKATQLISMGCNYLGGFDMHKIVELYSERAAVLSRATHTHDDLEDCPNQFRRTARDYLAGDDLHKHLSVSTFRRHRLALLRFGLDISVRRNVINFQPRVRVIELKAATVPSWYQLDERLVA